MYMKENPDYIIKEWTDETRKYIKRKSGAYAAYWGRICLYVGVSQSLEDRVQRFFTPNRRFSNKILGIVVNHCKDKEIKLWVKIYFHDRLDLRSLEIEYIKYLNSRLNGSNRPYRGRKTWRNPGY